MGAREPWGDWDTLHLTCRRHRNGTAVTPSPLTLGILPPLNPPSSHSSLLCSISSSHFSCSATCLHLPRGFALLVGMPCPLPSNSLASSPGPT